MNVCFNGKLYFTNIHTMQWYPFRKENIRLCFIYLFYILFVFLYFIFYIFDIFCRILYSFTSLFCLFSRIYCKCNDSQLANLFLTHSFLHQHGNVEKFGEKFNFERYNIFFTFVGNHVSEEKIMQICP